MSTNNIGVEKLYESENYVVVNKPYDMYINSDDENEKNTVTFHIAHPDSHLASSANPIHFVQRLDYSTSGVLCIARNKAAAARAGKLFENRLTRKYYLAVVRGHVDFEMGDIEYEVGADPGALSTSHRMCALSTRALRAACVPARRARTRVLPLETGYYRGDPVTVVLLKPITGRRHQLRVHCAAVCHTILGDYTYSAPRDVEPRRMFLHATRLVLPDPQEPLDIQTPDCFFSESTFSEKWKSETCLYKYRSKEEFLNVCDIIDKFNVIGVRYKMFKYSEE